VESAAQFSASNAALPSKSLKLAVREAKNQSEVWDSVAVMQAKLQPVTAAAPPPTGSMQLTLENREVAKATAAYVDNLAKITEGKPDVIGYAYAINGKINSADVYGSPDLFQKMWRKMLDAAAAEAASERQTGKTFTAPGASDVRMALQRADGAEGVTRENAGRVTVVKKDSGNVLLFEAREGTDVIHKGYVVK